MTEWVVQKFKIGSVITAEVLRTGRRGRGVILTPITIILESLNHLNQSSEYQSLKTYLPSLDQTHTLLAD